MLQIFIQNRVLNPILRSRKPARPPWLLRLLARFPRLRRIPAYVVGMGLRPEHVRVDAGPKSGSRRRAVQKKA
jgi:hypothetical protein